MEEKPQVDSSGSEKVTKVRGTITIDPSERILILQRGYMASKPTEQLELPDTLTTEDIIRDHEFWNNHLSALVAFYPNELIASVLKLNSTVIKNDELMERANQVRFDAAIVSANSLAPRRPNHK